jgi:hypothetical protein
MSGGRQRTTLANLGCVAAYIPLAQAAHRIA